MGVCKWIVAEFRSVRSRQVNNLGVEPVETVWRCTAVCWQPCPSSHAPSEAICSPFCKPSDKCQAWFADALSTIHHAACSLEAR